MSSPPPRPPAVDCDAIEARDLADFFAGQAPVDAEAASWRVRQQDGLSLEEEAELHAWLKQAPGHQAAFNRLGALFDALAELPPESIAQVKTRLQAETSTAMRSAPAQAQASRPARRPRSDQAPTWMRSLSGFVPQMTAAVLAFVVLGGSWYVWDYLYRQPVFTESYATSRGQQLDVHLPDGSDLELDTATRAEVVLYRKRREVTLSEGQAMFIVKPDADRPFDVLAGPLRISVVGTRFAVRNTRAGLSSDGIGVAVEEGHVRVAQASRSTQGELPGDAADLTAGQSTQSDASGRLGQVATRALSPALLWRERRVSFENTPLSHALSEFERYGATRLVVTDPRVGAMRVNGSFDLRQVDAFATALPHVLPVRMVHGNGVIEIVANP